MVVFAAAGIDRERAAVLHVGPLHGALRFYTPPHIPVRVLLIQYTFAVDGFAVQTRRYPLLMVVTTLSDKRNDINRNSTARCARSHSAVPYTNVRPTTPRLSTMPWMTVIKCRTNNICGVIEVDENVYSEALHNYPYAVEQDDYDYTNPPSFRDRPATPPSPQPPKRSARGPRRFSTNVPAAKRTRRMNKSTSGDAPTSTQRPSSRLSTSTPLTTTHDAPEHAEYAGRFTHV